jgi:hypothetical protein
MNISKFYNTVLVFAFLVLTHSVNAGIASSLMQTANVTEPNKYEAKLQGDIIFEGDGGFNIIPHLVTGLVDPFLDLDIYLGTGTTDFQIGSLVKFNVLPDLPEQVGLSFLFGGGYLRDEQENSFLLNFSILGSKEFLTSFGSATPYVAFQFEGLFNSKDDTSRVPLTLVLGSKLAPSDLKYNFYGEIGIGIHEANTYIGLGASYEF